MSLTEKQQTTQKHNVSQVASAWQGPLPSPEAVKQFDEIVESGAERIFRMAELEQQHRINSEKLIIQVNSEAARAEIKAAIRGAWMGFIVPILAIFGAVFTSSIGANWSVSVALVSIPVMGVVKTLVTRK